MRTLPQEVEPIKDIKSINKIKQYLLGKPSKRDYCIFVVGVNIGLRAGDLIRLKISDVFDARRVRSEVSIKEQKTGKTRNFAINKSAKEALELYLGTLKEISLDGYLFPSRKGGHIGVRPLHYIIKSTLRELGIKGNFGTHSLRKSFSYHRYIQGTPIETLQKILNHSSSSVTLRYIGIDKEVIFDAYNAVNL